MKFDDDEITVETSYPNLPELHWLEKKGWAINPRRDYVNGVLCDHLWATDPTTKVELPIEEAELIQHLRDGDLTFDDLP